MKAYWLIGIMMTAGLNAHAEDCDVNVYVITGPIPPGVLPDARLKAAAMFREIGVNVRMRWGFPSRDASNSCGAPIVIQFDDENDYRGPTMSLAYASPYKKSGTCIHVSLDRVIRADQNGHEGFANALLAHVMVHEITHVLEQIVRHSDEGVMKAVWSDRDYEIMKRHPLPFAPVDVDLIREGLARRIAHAAAE